MKRSGLLIASLATVVVAMCAVKAASWFDASSEQKPAINSCVVSDAERWYRTGQERHWRCYVLQSR